MEKLKLFLATKTGKIVAGIVIVLVVGGLFGGGCYIAGCNKGMSCNKAVEEK